MVVDEVGGGCDVEGGCGGAFYVDAVAVGLDVSVGFDQYLAFGFESCLDAFLSYAFDGGGKEAGLSVAVLEGRRGDSCVQLAFEADAEGKRSLRGGCQAADNHAICQGGKDLTLVADAPIHVGCGGDGVTEVQFAAVVCSFVVAQGQLDASEGEEAHAVGPFDEVVVDELGGFLFFSFEDEAAHLWEICQRLAAVVLVGRAAPEGFFVELDFLGSCAAEDHSPHVGVADGEGFEPVRCGLGVPELMLLRCEGEDGRQEYDGQGEASHVCVGCVCGELKGGRIQMLGSSSSMDVSGEMV